MNTILTSEDANITLEEIRQLDIEYPLIELIRKYRVRSSYLDVLSIFSIKKQIKIILDYHISDPILKVKLKMFIYEHLNKEFSLRLIYRDQYINAIFLTITKTSWFNRQIQFTSLSL